MKVRTLFISDMHLGRKRCKREKLYKFLRDIEAEKIYLVGDIFDIYYMATHWMWFSEHDLIVRLMLEKSKDTPIVYIPGNHDSFFRRYLGVEIGNFQLVNEIVHTGLDGKKYLVIHGDQFDRPLLHSHKVMYMILRIEHALDVDVWAKLVKYARPHIDAYLAMFEDVGVKRAEAANCDAIICGHTHFPMMSDKYINCGDWLQNSCAVVEHLDGRFELVQA